MNVPTFNVEMHIDYDSVQAAHENDLTHLYAVLWLGEYDAHVASGCVCGGVAHHCTVLAKATGHAKRFYTTRLKKWRKKLREFRRQQTVLRKKHTSKEHPIVIE